MGALALQNLQRDRVFGRLPAAEQEALLRRCVDFGMQLAAKVRDRLGVPADERALEQMLRAEGIVVDRIREDWNLPYLGEYLAAKRQITLYMPRIHAVAAMLETAHPHRLDGHPLSMLCLAHEFFHHEERKERGAVGRVLQLENRLFGIFPCRHTVAEGSEIAAHAFVQAWLDLPFSTYSFAQEIAGMDIRKEDIR